MLRFERPANGRPSHKLDQREGHQRSSHFLGTPGLPRHLGMHTSPGSSSAQTALEDYSEQKFGWSCCWYHQKGDAHCTYYPHARGARVYQDRQFNGL